MQQKSSAESSLLNGRRTIGMHILKTHNLCVYIRVYTESVCLIAKRGDLLWYVWEFFSPMRLFSTYILYIYLRCVCKKGISLIVHRNDDMKRWEWTFVWAGNKICIHLVSNKWVFRCAAKAHSKITLVWHPLWHTIIICSFRLDVMIIRCSLFCCSLKV